MRCRLRKSLRRDDVFATGQTLVVDGGVLMHQATAPSPACIKISADQRYWIILIFDLTCLPQAIIIVVRLNITSANTPEADILGVAPAVGVGKQS